MNLFADLSEIVRERVPLFPFTWFKLGGPARWLVEPRTEAELRVVVRRCHRAGMGVRFLGKGANLLVDDAGVEDAVVRLTGDHFGGVAIQGDIVTAGAGADLMDLVKNTAKQGLAGLEVLAGIPATVGGAIRMNCGGKYGEIGPRVESVRVMSADGAVRTRRDVRFHYRGTDLGGDRVLGATFQLRGDDPVRTFGEYERIWREKMASQPTLGERSAGCIFRNPPGDSAGKLIDECGLKGERVGGAEVSRRHANFIVARNGATAADVRWLINVVRSRVEARSGISLELEVEVWPAGEHSPSAETEHAEACLVAPHGG